MNKEPKQSGVPRHQYSAQFKEQALARALKDGVKQAALDLGITESALYAWRAKSNETGQPFETQQLNQAEFARLKRENARLNQENEFLKKAAAYFAKESK
jgi:transposase